MTPINGPGIFQAKPYRWELLRGQKTGSITLVVTCGLTKEFPPLGVPIDMSTEPREAIGKIYLVKKNGTYNERGFETLIDVFGWTDEMLGAMLPPNNWDAPECRVTVDMDTYDNAYRIRWFNRADGKRLQRATTPDELSEIQSIHGANAAAIGAAIRAGKPIPVVTPPVVPSTGPDEIPF